MRGGDLLGTFEQIVLLAVVRLRDSAYGMTVRQEIEERIGRAASLGAVYATLDRLEAKGYVSSSTAPGGPQRQGRAKRFFRVQPSGQAALRSTLKATEQMSEGLTLRKPAGGLG